MPDPGITAESDLLFFAIVAIGVLYGLSVLIRKVLPGTHRQRKTDANGIDFTPFISGQSENSAPALNRHPHKCPKCEVLLLEGRYGLECPRCHTVPPQ